MKKILTEFLQLYKDFPCLWDTRQAQYTNKEAKDQAYEVLLEKYREIQKDATMLEVKRKIEYMRGAYRRQHKKVLLSIINGHEEEYVPQLWYYNLMTFLNGVSDFSNLDSGDEPVPPIKIVKTTSLIKQEQPDLELPEPKRLKSSSPFANFLQGSNSNDEINDNQDEFTKNRKSSMCTSNTDSEAESFGKTIGLQLKELELGQRNIAEKLISEAIFFARFNSLTLHSKIINEEVKKDC